MPLRAEEELAEALTKLKALLNSGVLTEEQYEAERKRLLEAAGALSSDDT